MTEFTFDERAAETAVRFFERLLIQSKGEWAGEPFALLDWERHVLREVFGWKRADGTRRYRIAYIEVPRKNGKSTFCAGVALYLLEADGEPGAEVYSAAADREQAAIVFDEAKSMVSASPILSKRSQVFKRSITVQSERSVYRVLSADAYTKHGLNAHGVVFDELHAQPNRDLWDVLKTSMGARRQPLMVAITTAGYDRNSICWEMHEYARQVLDGTVEDASFFAYIAAAAPEDDWQDPVTWAKANPGLGVTVKLEYLQEEAKRAAQTPAYENTFRRLHLNQWTQQETRWLSIDAWDKCAGAVDQVALGGRSCYAGLDLASTTDIAALVLVFPDGEELETYDVLPFFWIPGDNIIARVRRDKVPYDAWVREGLVMATEGNVIDYEAILVKLDELAQRFDIKELAYDRWGATKLIQSLQDRGMNVIPFGQGFASMSPPTKETLNLVLSGRLRHGGNKVLRWMANNMVVRQDPAGNVKPDKSKSTEKIDGMVATIMGIDRATRKDDAGGRSAYDEDEKELLVL
ncbi:terminase large subunit [Casimicrobium huifangae]|uniref:terminase large subunit n=1 Tax=Casimicrobium huifangae TaxID=2591109 RepID=UPI003783CEF0